VALELAEGTQELSASGLVAGGHSLLANHPPAMPFLQNFHVNQRTVRRTTPHWAYQTMQGIYQWPSTVPN
jgi:hypothetical protein